MSELKGPLLVERFYCGEWIAWMVEHDLGNGTLEWWQEKCDDGDYRLREFTPGAVVWPEVVTYEWEFVNSFTGEWQFDQCVDSWPDSDVERRMRFCCNSSGRDQRVIDSTGKVHAHFRRVTRTVTEVEEVPC